MRALVAGATGFIGTVLTQRLVCGGADVRALVRSARRTRDLPAEKIELHEGDVLEPETLAGAGGRDRCRLLPRALDGPRRR